MWLPNTPKTLYLQRFPLVWHSRGQRFDPAYLHQRNLKSLENCGFQGFFLTFFDVIIFCKFVIFFSVATTVATNIQKEDTLFRMPSFIF